MKNTTIFIPKDVSCVMREWDIVVFGPLGTIYIDTYYIREDFVNKATLENGVLKAQSYKNYDTLLQTCVEGVKYGHLLKLKVRGPGYKVIVCKQNNLVLRVGYSHLCYITVPNIVKVSFNKHNQIFCYSISKEKLTAFADTLKRIKKPNRYHQKGVFKIEDIVTNTAIKKTGKGNTKK